MPRTRGARRASESSLRKTQPKERQLRHTQEGMGRQAELHWFLVGLRLVWKSLSTLVSCRATTGLAIRGIEWRQTALRRSQLNALLTVRILAPLFSDLRVAEDTELGLGCFTIVECALAPRGSCFEMLIRITTCAANTMIYQPASLPSRPSEWIRCALGLVLFGGGLDSVSIFN